MTSHLVHVALLLISSVLPLQTAPQAGAQAGANASQAVVLNATEAAKALPSSVFFRGQSASVQGRNSGGVQFSKDSMMLATLVDTSGYSSQLQQKYQAYLITEEPIEIGGHRLEPGAYGCGFVAGDLFLVMDIGGHDLFSVASTRDAGLRRPTPLQVVAAPEGNQYRFYEGRSFVTFTQAH